ncbi:MAG: hypothetical protein JW936_05075 [Sedimentisphaerales bacterium]|nr:hypothetical protein [Sedimentisphaerales bacterium]
MTTKKTSVDVFAQIAAETPSVEVRRAVLVEPRPVDLPARRLASSKSNPRAAFKPPRKVDTAVKLDRELERMRKSHAKFEQDLAGKLAQKRTAIQLKDFQWRLQTEADLADGNLPLQGKGRWQKVTIPHYGEPLGRAVTYYRSVFDLTAGMLRKGAVFACFQGVDYKAHVFVNNAYVGSHEGFFSPFEFDITGAARLGRNTILIKVENDAICMGNTSWSDEGYKYEGDKIYAATGLGYDDPEVGWHHCPPGMGIYQDVTIESRASVHVHDLFVRPMDDLQHAEVMVELYSCSAYRQWAALEYSIYGQNFKQTVCRDQRYEICAVPGNEDALRANPLGSGRNDISFKIRIPNVRVWSGDTPWLYQLQVKVLDAGGKVLDTAKRQFGMRVFSMDTKNNPKGRFFLNHEEIRLRGANTMGHMQQCVAKRDWKQLRDDILLAKLCNMNFFRLTQRPVQREIYEYCDRLGMMTQSDLPLFGCLRKTQFCEGVRQAEEMERLVRSHPCNIMVSYINEPFPNAFNKPHRYLNRVEMEEFFEAASCAVRLANPDRVIKYVDGDYDPPSRLYPDNHCYNGWYNGHGLDLGKLHKGYWQKVMPGWHYGCGEFGSEGLESVEVMRKYYPKSWLPQSAKAEKTWSPSSIVKAQTGNFHYMWFETQDKLEDWVRVSQEHQAWITKLMTEAFRRDSRLNSQAIHLFIDAFPSGWMKTIMDVERRPKKAYFVYREALSPLLVSLRTDRYAFVSDEGFDVEAWVCNDRNDVPAGATLRYQWEMNGKVLFAQKARAEVPINGSAFQGHIRIKAPSVEKRSKLTVRLALTDRAGTVLNDNSLDIEIFPKPARVKKQRVYVIGSKRGKAAQLAGELDLDAVYSGPIGVGDVVLVDDFKRYSKVRSKIDTAVKSGARLVFLELPAGEYRIGGDKLEINNCGMGDGFHFVSRRTGHELAAGMEPNDFRFWYDSAQGYVTPLVHSIFSHDNWRAILTSGAGVWGGQWGPALAAAEKRFGQGQVIVCQVALGNRTRSNPTAAIFARRLLTR